MHACKLAWSAKSGEDESGRKSVGCQQRFTSLRMGRTVDSMYLSIERSRSNWCEEMLCSVCTPVLYLRITNIAFHLSQQPITFEVHQHCHRNHI